MKTHKQHIPEAEKENKMQRTNHFSVFLIINSESELEVWHFRRWNGRNPLRSLFRPQLYPKRAFFHNNFVCDGERGREREQQNGQTKRIRKAHRMRGDGTQKFIHVIHALHRTSLIRSQVEKRSEYSSVETLVKRKQFKNAPDMSSLCLQ